MQPSSEPVPKPKRKVTAILPDERYMPVFREIDLSYRARNNNLPVPWNAKAGKLLNQVLRSLHSWPLEDLLICVRHRYWSDSNHSEDPARWISNLASYRANALNKFGKPKLEMNYDDQQYLGRKDKMREEQLKGIASVGDIAKRVVKEKRDG